MNYIGNDKLNRVCLGEYNKTYLGNDILYWNTSNEVEEVGSYIRVELNDQWQLSTETYNTAYVGYESFSNYNIHNSLARMRVYFKGYDTFDFKIMSNGENNFDYVMVGYLDYDWSDGTYNTMQYNKSNIYSHTRGKKNTWVDVTFSINDDNEHFFDVAYRKDSSNNTDADKGYINLMLEILGEKWVASDTEWIEEDGKYYIKENKYVTVNNIDWIKTSESRKGMELTIGYELVDGYLCDNGNKYQKMELYFTNHPTMTGGIGVYTIGDMLEENSTSCEWITLTTDTDRSIPMQTFRIDATDPGTSGNYFITFNATPNYDGDFSTITIFSICPDEGIIFDNNTRKIITSVATHIEGNIYEYTFSQVVYFAGGEVNAPLSQVQYRPM